MVINDWLRHMRLLGEPPKCQGFRTLLPDQPPCDVDKLAISVLARQAATGLGIGSLASCFSA
ncbi:hypothetical protein PPNSA23_46430 [Phyllobacterium phragmitis]|uniref:Uncharacterized protein n=1 Tax=Phyllobacterium phragmitis TaxID=2670329 RepID=A0ABQ0H720_9HYPH